MTQFQNLFHSKKQDWNTDKVLFNILNLEFNFNYDLACDDENKLCGDGFTEKENALVQDWGGTRGWLNPPFGKRKQMLKDWVKKSYDESQKENTLIMMMIPARTNTNWWSDHVMKSKEVRFIKGRPKFKGNIHGLPQPLALVLFQKHNESTKYTSFSIPQGTECRDEN